MNSISVAEMLKLKGKWTVSKEFVSFVAEKLGTSERMAYIKIKKALAKNEIIKATLQDRTVLYGLPEFGAPRVSQSVAEYSLWKEHAFQEFSRIRNMINNPNGEIVERVPEDTLLCIKTLLPPEIKEKLKPDITKLENRLADIDRSTSVRGRNPTSIMRSRKLRSISLFLVAHEVIPGILEKIFALLRGEE
jgi:hypothetical protein